MSNVKSQKEGEIWVFSCSLIYADAIPEVCVQFQLYPKTVFPNPGPGVPFSKPGCFTQNVVTSQLIIKDSKTSEEC